MLDPRPYTYEFRKPRLNNPTFRSSNMYDSLYHLRFPSTSQYVQPRSKNMNQQNNNFSSNNSQTNNNYIPQRYQNKPNDIERPSYHTRQHSMDLRVPYQNEKAPRNVSLTKEVRERVDSKLSDYQRNNGIQSHLSNYGDNLMKSSQFNRFSVYEKQQKGFNIINLQPKQMANSLRNFPKLTLQDKLIENGRYNRG